MRELLGSRPRMRTLEETALVAELKRRVGQWDGSWVEPGDGMQGQGAHHFAWGEAGATPGGGVGRAAVVALAADAVGEFCACVVGVDDIVGLAGVGLGGDVGGADGAGVETDVGRDVLALCVGRMAVVLGIRTVHGRWRIRVSLHLGRGLLRVILGLILLQLVIYMMLSICYFCMFVYERNLPAGRARRWRTRQRGQGSDGAWRSGEEMDGRSDSDHQRVG